MNTFAELIRPLIDARLVLALVIIVCATALAYQGKIDPVGWVTTAGIAAWWSGSRRMDGADDVNLKSRGLS